MIDIIRSDLRTKLLTLLISTLLILFIGVWVGLSSMSDIIDEYSAAVNKTVRYSIQVSELNVRFKTHVQEWKTP